MKGFNNLIDSESERKHCHRQIVKIKDFASMKQQWNGNCSQTLDVLGNFV